MNARAFSLLPQALIYLALGIGVYGALTHTMFDQWRRISLLDSAYKSAVKKGTGEVDNLILVGDPALSGLYAPITDPTLKAAYETAKKTSQDAVDAFFVENVLPGSLLPWLCFVGLFLAFPLWRGAARGLFTDFTGKMAFTTALIGLLSGYFFHLQQAQIYPMGIDLAGGTELIYRLDFESIDRRMERLKAQIDDYEVRMNKGERDPEDNPITQDTIESLKNTLQGMDEGIRSAPEKAAEIVRQRIDPTGTKGIPVTSYDSNTKLRIQLPRATLEEVERVKKAISTQGRLTFHICLDPNTQNDTIQKIRNSPDKEWNNYIMKVIEDVDRYDPTNVKTTEVFMRAAPDMEGSQVVFAGIARGEQGGWEVRLQFDAAGSAEFARLTERNIGKNMAIVLDGKCYSAPTIQTRIAGECRITGKFTKKEADDLANVLTAGSLPAEVILESTFTVGPSLGRQQIESGVQATLIGAVLVAIFVFAYYRLSGFIAVLCLGLNLLTLLGALGFFKATMTLPGIAGILLTLGMAVDANVLIFERIREEIARGRQLRLAIQHGFDRAFITILDAQLTTLISGIILYYLGTGPVRGFAVTLSVGILITIFANFWICRNIFMWLASRDALENLSMMQIMQKANFNFMQFRHKGFGFSAVLVSLSFIGFLIMGVFSNRIYDVDFTGGTLTQFDFRPGKYMTIGSVREQLDKSLVVNLKKRLEETSKSLAEIAEVADSKQRLSALNDKLPEIATIRFATQSELEAQTVLSVKAEIDEVIKEYGDVDFTAQTFGTVSENGHYRSFTLTTRLTNNIVMQFLNDELLRTFGDALEPLPVEAIGNDTIRVRFKSDLSNPAAAVTELRTRITALAIEKEFSALQNELRALDVGEAKPAGDEVEAHNPYVNITGIPTDPAKRSAIVGVLQDIKLEAKTEGPIARTSSFGTTVSGEMTRAALFSMLAAMIGIFVYLWFRFEFSAAWGVGAIAALVHDAMIAVGAVCFVNATGIFPVLIDLNLVAALLTIIGYSVNDTIVVFDRIREIRHQHPTRNIVDVVNEGVNATLSRTILTSGTTLLALGALLVFGGQTIRDLSFTLFIGILVGTYSSIFVASPILVWWIGKYGTGKAPVPGGAEAQATKKAAPSGAQI